MFLIFQRIIYTVISWSILFVIYLIIYYRKSVLNYIKKIFLNCTKIKKKYKWLQSAWFWIGIGILFSFLIISVAISWNSNDIISIAKILISLLAALGTIAAVWTNIYYHQIENSEKIIIKLEPIPTDKSSFEKSANKKWKMYVINNSEKSVAIAFNYIYIKSTEDSETLLPSLPDRKVEPQKIGGFFNNNNLHFDLVERKGISPKFELCSTDIYNAIYLFNIVHPINENKLISPLSSNVISKFDPLKKANPNKLLEEYLAEQASRYKLDICYSTSNNNEFHQMYKITIHKEWVYIQEKAKRISNINITKI